MVEFYSKTIHAATTFFPVHFKKNKGLGIVNCYFFN